MAAIVHSVRSSAAVGTPGKAQPSSAPVLEYACLFTHDLRRKQKRWQDGRLKFHSFNKRVMVYDERGNFIGDTHWREDYDLDEGEEIQLERGGIIVQVSECVAKRDQDLSELIDKRVQEKAQRQSHAAARHTHSVPGGYVQPARAQIHHTHLHHVIGTPSGHHGRASAPLISPFEERQRTDPELSNLPVNENPRPAKRRKKEASPPSKSGYAQSLFGAPLTLSGRPMSSAPTRHRPKKTWQSPPDDQNVAPMSDPSDENEEDRGSHPRGSNAVEPLHRNPAPVLSDRTPTVVNLPTGPRGGPQDKDAQSITQISSPLLHHEVVRSNKSSASLTLNQSGPTRIPPPITQVEETVVPVPLLAKNRMIVHERSFCSRPVERRSVLRKPERTNTTSDSEKKIHHDEVTPRNRAGAKQSLRVQKIASETSRTSTTARSSGTIVDNTGPMIELRIKPTKKRGLLMVSERNRRENTQRSTDRAHKHDIDPSDLISSTPTSKADQASAEANTKTRLQKTVRQRRSIEGNETVPQIRSAASRSKHHTPPQDNPANNGGPFEGSRMDNVESHGDSAASLFEQVGTDKRLEQKPYRQITTPAALACVTSGRAQSTLLKATDDARTSPEGSISTHSDDEYDPTPHPNEKKQRTDDTDTFFKISSNASPPRLAPPSRKNLKSREIIGLVFESDEDLPLVSRDLAILSKQTFFHMAQIPKKTSTALDDTHVCESADFQTKSADFEKPQPPSFNRSGDIENTSGNPTDQDAVAWSMATAQSRATSMHQLRTSRVPRSESPEEIVEKPLNTQETEENSNDTHRGSASSKNSAAPLPSSYKIPERISDSPSAQNRVLSPISGVMPDRLNPLPPNSVSILDVPPEEQNSAVPHNLSASHFIAGSITPDLSESCHQGSGNRRDESGFIAETSEKPNWAHGSSPKETIATVHEQPHSHVDITVTMKATSQKAIPKIANPATRGKKAARPADAAGQVPEGILLSEGSDGNARQINRPVVRDKENSTREEPALAGFSRANGGPWSREAHDLFDFRRPAQI